MPTLSEIFEKRLLSLDGATIAEQRSAVIESMFAEVGQINADLAAIDSGVRFSFTGGRGGSVHSYQMRYESGFVNNSGVKSASRMMYVEFPIRSAEIIICKDDWGEIPNIKAEPDEILTSFSLDATQAVRDMMAEDMMGVLSEKDKYELKLNYLQKRRQQEIAQDVALK